MQANSLNPINENCSSYKTIDSQKYTAVTRLHKWKQITDYIIPNVSTTAEEQLKFNATIYLL